VSHKSACKAEHVRDSFVLGASVSDQDRRAGHPRFLGDPPNSWDRLGLDPQVEALLDDALLHLLAQYFHDSTP
jgi:hypothetical protein